MSKKVMLIALSIALVAALVGGATMAWFTDEAVSDPVTFAAGTVMIEAGSSSIASQYFDPTDGVFLYGIEAETGDIYEINVKQGLSEEARFNRIYKGGSQYPYPYPNGLAFDDVNDRLYFATDNKTLYFYDLSENVAKRVHYQNLYDRGAIYGATFGDGYYWFIPDNKKVLHRFAFNPDGTWKETLEDIPIPSNVSNVIGAYGDIALDYRDGFIYGSNSKCFFAFDIAEEKFSVISTQSDVRHLQVAYGSDGNLYAQSGHEAGSGDWYEITVADDLATATRSESLFQTDMKFVDLACGYRSVWNPGDCAWARFNVKNVGTKNSYVRLDLSDQWQEFVDGTGWVDWSLDPEEYPDCYAGDVVEISLSSAGWTKVEDKYYYNSILDPNGTAELSVKICLNGPNTCNAYQGKRFVLTGTFDAIQTTHNAPAENDWDWSPGQ